MAPHDHTAAPIEYQLLGPIDARRADVALSLGGPRRRVLLGLLLVHRNTPVATERIVDWLFAGEAGAAAANAAHAAVSRLRRSLAGGNGDGPIARGPAGYVLHAADDQVDAARFEQLLRRSGLALEGGRPEDALALLDQAVALWRGPALAEATYEAFAAAEVARLTELRTRAEEERAAVLLELGRHAEAVGDLEGLVARYPLRERLRGLLMLALYRTGRQADALQACREARSTLVEGLGLDPSRELEELERAMLRHDAALDWHARGPAAGVESPSAPAPRVLAHSADAAGLAAVTPYAAVLATGGEVILVRTVAHADDLPEASGDLRVGRARLAAQRARVRTAAFASSQPGRDVGRLAAETDATLVIGHLPRDGPAREQALSLLAAAAIDVALLCLPTATPAARGPVVTPFGGGVHDEAALLLAGRAAVAWNVPLVLLGGAAGPGGRDASLLLAHASLALQRAVGVEAVSRLVQPGPDGVVEGAAGARLLVLGVPLEPRVGGLAEREALALRAGVPALVVQGAGRGVGLRRELTRFAWSRLLAGEATL